MPEDRHLVGGARPASRSAARTQRGEQSQGTQGYPPWAGRVAHVLCGPSDGPTLTRLRNGGPGQAMEVPTLLPGSRPTSACFLSADHSNLRLQTSSGSCTKRIGEQCRVATVPRGESQKCPSGSVTPGGPGNRAEGCCPLTGALVGAQGRVRSWASALQRRTAL